MPREKETLRKVHAKGKRDVKKKMPRLQEKEISRKGMPRETDVRKETCRENKRPQEKDMPRERETSRKRCQDFKRKRF